MSIRLWQSEYLFRHETQNEVRADRRYARNERFAQIAFDVIFLRVPHAAKRHDRRLTRFIADFRGEIFGGVRFRTARLAGVIQTCGFIHEQTRRFELDP